MYSHILVPIAYDHDHDEGRPLDIARKLCRDGGKVTFLHVMEEIPGYAINYMPDDFPMPRREW
jgi:universal stress protein F